MPKYHKIHSIYKRYSKDKLDRLQESGIDTSNIEKNSFILNEYSRPEFESLKNIEWQFTEKVDGTNIRIRYNEEFGVEFLGRTEKSQTPKKLLDKLAEIFPKSKFEEVFPDLNKHTLEDDKVWNPTFVTLYGEGYGASIQKGGGGYIKDGVGFILFDVRIGHMWLRRDSIQQIASQLGLPIVPIIGEGTLEDGINLCREGFSSHLRSSKPEGLIAKPKVELLDRRGQRIITKIKLCDFETND